MDTPQIEVTKHQPVTTAVANKVTEPPMLPTDTPEVLKPLASINIVRKRGNICAIEGRELASKNGSIKTWLVLRQSNLQLSSIQEEEGTTMSMMEVDVYMMEVDQTRPGVRDWQNAKIIRENIRIEHCVPAWLLGCVLESDCADEIAWND